MTRARPPLPQGWAAAVAALLVVTPLTGCSGGDATTARSTPGAASAGASSSRTGETGRATATATVPAGATPSSTTATTGPAAAPVPSVPPPYVAGVRWVTLSSGRSLQVRPTAAGRATDALYPEAWREVVRLAPGADTPGMEAQFSCHWTFARTLAPDKPSWNLEPWRPVVSTQDMLAAGCNPGGREE